MPNSHKSLIGGICQIEKRLPKKTPCPIEDIQNSVSGMYRAGKIFFRFSPLICSRN